MIIADRIQVKNGRLILPDLFIERIEKTKFSTRGKDGPFIPIGFRPEEIGKAPMGLLRCVNGDLIAGHVK